ncbi:MAG: hypothetical protein K0U37_09610 [Gammaproteobacteria bacterium]|nr:hypothetical protein [Gammaproteobacteria bacterium]
MSTQPEQQYQLALNKLKLKVTTTSLSTLFNPPSPMKAALSTLIELVEELKAQNEVSIQCLTEALDSTNDLLEGRISLERYHQIADCMLSSAPPQSGRSLLGICMHYLSVAVFWVSLVTLFVGPVVPAVLGLVASYFLNDLQKYIDSGQSKTAAESTPLADGMRLFSSKCSVSDFEAGSVQLEL